MTPVLSVEDLSVSLGTVPAVQALSFSIAAGEVLGLVGESGAGKSLAATAVLGLLPPPAWLSGGRILLEGRRIDTLPDRTMRRLRGRVIGAVFQDPLACLNPLMTVGRQLVQTIRTHLPLDRAAAVRRAEALLAEVGIPAPRTRMAAYPHQLSGGMRQRVVLALAFAAGPRLIIADEPTTALDVSLQAQVIALLRRLCADHGTAVLLITHDMGVIAEAADRVGVMYAGRLVEIGPVAQVLGAARHPYSRALMAAIPGMVSDGADLPQIPGSMPRPGGLPGGCAFHPRCGLVLPRCATTPPPPVAAAAASCWLEPAHG